MFKIKSKTNESRVEAPKVKLIMPNEEVVRDKSTGQVGITSQQLITDDFLANLRDRRLASRHVREREFMHIASIPAIFVDKWAREGFNILSDKNITVEQVVARLKRENLTDFMATTKNISKRA